MRPTIFEFMNEVERSFEDVWRSERPMLRQPSTFTPAVDLHETDGFYLVSLDLPGVTEKDINIGVQEGRLTISGERHREEQANEGLYRRFERSVGKFERSFQLPTNVTADKIQARFENGVLEVMIPKAEAAKPRQVKIETAKGGLFSRLLGQKDAQPTIDKKENH